MNRKEIMCGECVVCELEVGQGRVEGVVKYWEQGV